MKNKVLLIATMTSFSAMATEYKVVLTSQDVSYEIGSAYLPTGEISCSVLSPLASSVYKGTHFNQSQSSCNETYRNNEGLEKLIPIDDSVESITGELVLSSCKEILSNSHSRGDDYYTINTNGTEIETICDMTTDGGGWTLVASMADDNQNYWTWTNISYLYNGNITGDIKNLKQDYQNSAWSTVIANEVMFTNTQKTKYLIYSNILSNEAMKSEHYVAQTTSPEYTPRLKSGSWWFETACDNNIGYMRTSTPDSDGNGWLEGAKGFVWRSVNNNACNYDDTSGSLNHAHPTTVDIETGWGGAEFYTNNFNNDAMVIWVK